MGSWIEAPPPQHVGRAALGFPDILPSRSVVSKFS